MMKTKHALMLCKVVCCRCHVLSTNLGAANHIDEGVVQVGSCFVAYSFFR
jgi:hypothetical protein